MNVVGKKIKNLASSYGGSTLSNTFTNGNYIQATKNDRLKREQRVVLFNKSDAQ